MSAVVSDRMTIEHPASEPTHAVELTVVMPCLNESLTLERCIRKAQKCMQEHGIQGEVVIGDNGSTDGSQDLARSLGARVIDVKVRGYGAAIYHAVLQARGKYVIMGDSDDSYNFADLMPFITQLRAGYDLVMGNRFKGGILPGAMPWKNRYIGNPALTGIGRLLFNCPASDFHCGLRGFSAKAFREMDLQTTGMEFASEMVIKATLMHMKIAEVPTTLAPDGRDRPPHLRPWRDGWRHLRFMCLYSPKWLFLYPGLLLMLLGMACLAWLLPGPRRIGGITLDVHTLLFAASAILLGFQAISFAIMAKGFVVVQGLLPSSRIVQSTVGAVRTEVGILAGLALIVCGIAATTGLVAFWKSAGFGELEVSSTFRVAIPAVLGIVLGGQIMLTSFFLDIMRLSLRKRAD